MKKKAVLFCAFVLMVSLSSGQTSRLGVNRYGNGTGINFSYGNINETSLLYFRYGAEYLFIDKDFINQNKGDNAFYSDDVFNLFDSFDVFMQTGVQYGFLLNLPEEVNFWTGARLSPFYGVYGELGGYYMLTNGIGVSLNVGYKFVNGIRDSSLIEDEGIDGTTRDGFFFGGGIVF